MVYAASVSAKSTNSQPSLSANVMPKAQRQDTLTSEAGSGAPVERQVSPLCGRGILLHGHVFVPALGAEQLGVHAVEIGSSVHGIHAEGDVASL